MKRLKKFIRLIFYMIITLLITYVTLTILVPEKIDTIMNYKFRTVLTNSMEPTIPTYSLVCVKNFKEGEVIDLQPGQIITFHANRFGETIVITHRFNKTEINADGNIIYRTNAEGKEDLDAYETKKDDLIGTYTFHIPYIGKFVLFFKSKYGLLWYAELITIFLINNLIKAFWEEKHSDSKKCTA